MNRRSFVIHSLVWVFISTAGVDCSSQGEEPSLVASFDKSTDKEQIYFRRAEEGWHFYNELEETEANSDSGPHRPPENHTTNRPEIPAVVGSQSLTLTPLQELQQIQQDLENARAAAVLHPSKTTVRDYLIKNQWMMQKAALFADQWRRVVWQTPSLDYSRRRPNNNLALQAFHDQRQFDIAHTMEQVARDYGLWFFYRSRCAYCQRFAPILRAFSDQYGFKVMAVSLDGGVLPEFSNSRFDQKVARELGVESVPSVFLVNPGKHEITPVTHGLVSEKELKERIYILTAIQPGEDF